MKQFLPILRIAACVAVISSSCNTKEETPLTEDNLYFVRFVIDGDTIYYEDGKDNYGSGPGVMSVNDSLGRLHSQFSTFKKNIATPNNENNVLTIQMVKFFTDTARPSYNAEFLLFDEGTYNYGSWNGDSTQLGIDGVIIAYTDNDGTVWSSDAVFGSQTGSESYVISLHKAAATSTLFGAKTKGIFNCRVYNGLGGFIDLENGNFHARTMLNP